MEISGLITDMSSNCNKIKKVSFNKGDLITSYIDKRKQICILISGKADLIRYDLNGNKSIVDKATRLYFYTNDFYPINNNNELFVQATEKCEVLIFAHNDIKEKCKLNCKYHSSLISNLLELIINNTIHQNTRIEILSKRTIREKLLSYFSILSSKNYNKTIIIPFSLTSLAEYLSVDRSAMMREIKNLIDEGFIQKEGKNKLKLLY